jgi:hypothetical protein
MGVSIPAKKMAGAPQIDGLGTCDPNLHRDWLTVCF